MKSSQFVANLCSFHLKTSKMVLSVAWLLCLAPTIFAQNHVQGRWEDATDLPLLAGHANLMPDGRVLLFSRGDVALGNSKRLQETAGIWDPGNVQAIAPGNAASKGTFTSAYTGLDKPPMNNKYELFCGSHGFLPDGRLIVSGATTPDYSAPNRRLQTAMFNAYGQTPSWSAVRNANVKRYYPSAMVYPNGDFISIGGNGLELVAPHGAEWPADWERYTLTGEWRRSTLSGKSARDFKLDPTWYTWFYLSPSGKAFEVGPINRFRSIDLTGDGMVQNLQVKRPSTQEHMDYGSAAQFSLGKILIMGGSDSFINDTQPDLLFDPRAKEAFIVDISDPQGGNPKVSKVASMKYGRTYQTAIALADGTVMVHGGHSKGGRSRFDMPSNVKYPELYNPETNTWTTLAATDTWRQYHHTAVLLRDGRVMFAGTGYALMASLNSSFNQMNSQVYWPPYLFDANNQLAKRPTIVSTPDSVGNGQTFLVKTGNGEAASIKKVNFIKTGSVTHGFDFSSRVVPLTFQMVDDSTLSVTIPANRFSTPPGHYNLFLINDKGTPSVGSTVRMDPYPTVRLVHVGTGKVVERTANNVGKLSAVGGNGSLVDRKLAQMYDLVPANSDPIPFADGSFYLQSRVDLRPLTVGGTQRWKLVEMPRGGVAFASATRAGFCLSTPAVGVATAGAALNLVACNQNDGNQEFALAPLRGLMLSSKDTGYQLKSDGAVGSQPTLVDPVTYTNPSSQRWKVSLARPGVNTSAWISMNPSSGSAVGKNVPYLGVKFGTQAVQVLPSNTGLPVVSSTATLVVVSTATTQATVPATPTVDSTSTSTIVKRQAPTTLVENGIAVWNHWRLWFNSDDGTFSFRSRVLNSTYLSNVNNQAVLVETTIPSSLERFRLTPQIWGDQHQADFQIRNSFSCAMINGALDATCVSAYFRGDEKVCVNPTDSSCGTWGPIQRLRE